MSILFLSAIGLWVLHFLDFQLLCKMGLSVAVFTLVAGI